MSTFPYVAIAADSTGMQGEVTEMNQATQESLDDGRAFDIGDVVDVMPRLWSGINKPGGAARIKEVTYDEEEEEHTYTVKYILGGIEKEVSGVYITSADLNGKKQRGTIGRCRWCNSFIKDCEHDPNVDPFLQPEPAPRFVNHQQAAAVRTNSDTITNLSSTHQPPKKRKRSDETTEQRQARKQQSEKKLLQMQQARREALQAREAEQEQLLLSTTFLPDDESTLDGNHPDMYDSMDLADDEEWIPSDSELATALPGRVGRVVQDSSDDEEVPRSIPEKLANKSHVGDTRTVLVAVATASHSIEHARPAVTAPLQPSAAPLTARAPSATLVPTVSVSTKDASQTRLPASPGPAPVPVTITHAATAVTAASAVTAAPAGTAVNTTSMHASHTNTNNPAHHTNRAPAPPILAALSTSSRSYTHMSAVDIAQDLHQRILESCVGSAAFGFINNSRSALNDRTAAAVNDTFNQLIASIKSLSEEAKIALYHVTFDWFASLYRENMFDAPLEAIEASHKALRNGQKAELSRLQKELDVLDHDMEVTLQQLARAGFDVFEKLGKIKDKEVRRMRKSLDAYNSQVSGTRVSARKRLERLRLRLQETSELWGCIDSESSHSGSDSDGDASTSRHGNYSTHVPNFPATKMARATSSTSFSRSHSNNPHSLSRSSTNSSGRHADQTVKRARSGTNVQNDENNDFSVDFDVHEDEASTADARRQRGGKGNSAPRTASSLTALSRFAGNNRPSNVNTATARPPYSKRVNKEMEFIFGSAKTRRNTNGTAKVGRGGGAGGFSGSSSNQDLRTGGGGTGGGANVGEDPATDRFVSLYRRAPAPSVLDLPRHIRYHGRVTVLEGPLMGTVVVPAAIERSPSYSLDAASTAWSGSYSAPTPMASGAEVERMQSSGDRFDSTPAVSAPQPSHSLAIAPSYTATASNTLVRQFTEPERASTQASLDSLDESLVDVVLSSMVNPFVVEPPLHLRRQFYQLPSLLELSGADSQAADEVWAEMFVNHLVAEAAAVPQIGETSAPEGILRGLSLAATSAVHVILQRLALYEEASARSSQLHPNHTPRIIKSGFKEQTAFAELVNLATEKLCRLNALFAGVTSRLFLSPAAGSIDLIERVSNVKSFTHSFDTMAKVTYSRVAKARDGDVEYSEDIADEDFVKPAAKGILAQNLCTFLRLSTIEDCKGDELAVFVALSLLRMKVATLKNCAFHTLETAKTRPLIDANDVVSVMDRIEEEMADWEVMNGCFSALLAQQQDVISALLANHRLTLAVLHYLSEIPPPQEIGLASAHATAGGFERGISGVAKLVAGLLLEILASLRALHGSINAARASSSASAHGTRVWASYDASREQANGVIATYPKHVWRDVVLAIYAHIVCSLHSPCDSLTVSERTAWFDEKQLMRAKVNPVVHRQRHNAASRPDEGESLAYLSEKETLWAVVTIFTHLLRTVKMTEFANGAISPTVSASNRASSRVDCAWSLLKGLAHATLESALHSVGSISSDHFNVSASEVEMDPSSKEDSSPGGADVFASLLRRVGHFAALWTDSPTEATALTLSLLHKSSPRFGSLFPLYGTVFIALESRGASKSAHASGPPALDQKSVLFLCFYAFFDHRHAARNHQPDVLEVRNVFSKHLAFLMSMLFETFKLPHNVSVSAQHRSINAALDTGNRQRELTQSSLRALDAVRDAFKALLYNAYSEACAPHDGTTITSNLADIRSAANKLPRTHQKLRLLALLERNDGAGNGHFQAGTVLLSLLAEMVSFFGPEAVRQKLKLAPASGTVAMPLQQQVMELLSHKLLLATQGASSVSAAGGVSVPNVVSSLVSGTGAGDSLLSEVDRLLQRVPIHQQQQQQNKSGGEPTSAIGTIAVISAPTSLVPELDASAVYLCLLWQAGLITFQPFPNDPASLTAHEETRHSNMLQGSVVKRIVESQRAEFPSVEPLLHLLRQSLQLQQNRSQLVNIFGAKAFADTSLGASLAVCAVVLGNMDAVLGARGAIALDTLAGSSGDVVSTRYQLVLLVTPFFSELLNVVHACMAFTESSASKDGLPYSAAFVFSQFVLYLRNWHRASRQLLSAAQSALNIDSAARDFLISTLREEEDKLCHLLSGALRLRPAPAVSSYKSSHAAVKTSPSALVASLLTLLTSLSHSISKTDISVLDPSALFRTASGDTCTAEMARKIRMHKGNTSPGCCLAICQTLGTLIGLITDVTSAASSTVPPTAPFASSELNRSGLAAALVSEVTECLEKIDQSATTIGANALLGNWLKVVFWLPILQAAALEMETVAAGRRGVEHVSCLSLVSVHFPALVCVWVGCAALGEATTTSHRILQQIDFATFHRLLVQLAPVFVQELQTKSSSVGMAKLSSTEMQCLRLAEAFVQVNSLLINSHNTNASLFVVKFLRLLSAGSASSVLASLLHCTPVLGGSGISDKHTHSFPATHRASFEATNVKISRELLKCLQVLKLETFRCGETPKLDSAEAKQKHALESSAAMLKGLFGDIAYLYRVLVVGEVPSAEFHPSGAAVGHAGAVRLTARLLRNLHPFPRMVTLDLAFSFLGDIVEQDAMATIGLMFKHAARGDSASPEQHSALKKALHRNFLCNVPKYLLLASDTPYSTRQTAWRTVLAPMLLTPAHTATGLYLAKQLATSKSVVSGAVSAPAFMPMLIEQTMGEEAYFTLLVCALTLALPVPEQLALLGPAASRAGDQSLGTKFVELLSARLKLPVKQATLWALYAQLVEIVKNTSMGSFPTLSLIEGDTAAEETQRQDSQLTRFKQYLLFGGGASGHVNTIATGTGVGANKLGSNLTGQSNLLWEQISSKATEVLRLKIAEDQQRLSLQRNVSFQPASAAMFVLPWAAVRACLYLHTCALEDVLESLIATQRVTPPTSVVSVSSFSRAVPNVGSEREDLLSLLVASAVYAVRGATSLCDMQHQVRASYPLITETSKQLLQSLMQYCTLAGESVNSAWSHLQVMGNENGNSGGEAGQGTVDLSAEAEMMGVWCACMRQMSQVLKMEVLIQSDICAFVMSCWQLLRCFYQLANCNNMLIVESFLTSAAPLQGTVHSLPPAPQVIFAATQCACQLCNHSSNLSAIWDGTENVSCVQTLQLAAVQLHRDLQRTLRTNNNAALSAQQSTHLRDLLGAKLDGVFEDLERVSSV